MAFSGQSASNADRLYRMNTKVQKAQVIDDLSARELKDIQLGECKAWNYVNAKGDIICCRYYLPPHFDAAKKYPMVVNYYGGCSPTSRMFQSRYPHHVYAAMGYVVLVVNPSGATGFGQKFSARHVDTAGEGVAEDIIASTQAFCDEHGFVNRKKIGCIGASYGGFMTQYLQTKTDLFAAAISHAGISDHTSYWGEGYWGYSYSQVSMANEYPWTNKHLFVDQSPLYRADKIHTPLLFLHGTADNNVPVGESIQLYTALKVLGRPTAMVLVDGQDHHIIDYESASNGRIPSLPGSPSGFRMMTVGGTRCMETKNVSLKRLTFFVALSQIYDFCFREIFAVEDESAVRHILSSEIAHLDCAPGTALSHLDDRRNVGFLVDGDNQFLYRTPLVLSNQVNLIVAASIFRLEL